MINDFVWIVLFHLFWTGLVIIAFSPFYTVQWTEVLSNWLIMVIALTLTIRLM